MMRDLLIHSVAALGLAMASLAADLDSRVTQLDDAIRAEFAEKEKAAEKAGNERAVEAYGLRSYGLSSLSNVRSAIQRGNLQDVENALAQLNAMFSSEAVKKSAAALLEQAKIEQAAREDAALARIDGAIETARKAVAGAKVAADLDEALNAVNAVREDSQDQSSERVRNAWRRLQAVRQFLVNWQDYLAARAVGDAQSAQNALRQASNNENAGLLPRSEILARLAEVDPKQKPSVAAVDEVLREPVTLATLPAAIDQLKQAAAGVSSSGRHDIAQTYYNVRDALAALRATHQQYLAGLPARFQVGEIHPQGHGDEYTAYVLPPRIELIRLVLPEFVGTDEPLANDETVEVYLDRVFERASTELDTSVMSRVLEMRAALASANPTGQDGFEYLVAARNQEQAGQMAPAVQSYLIALQIGGDAVPAEVVGRRLKAIEAAHPEAYEKGSAAALEGRMPVRSFSRMGRENGVITIPGTRDALPRGPR